MTVAQLNSRIKGITTADAGQAASPTSTSASAHSEGCTVTVHPPAQASRASPSEHCRGAWCSLHLRIHITLKHPAENVSHPQQAWLSM
jgi:hypothetical protein